MAPLPARRALTRPAGGQAAGQGQVACRSPLNWAGQRRGPIIWPRGLHGRGCRAMRGRSGRSLAAGRSHPRRTGESPQARPAGCGRVSPWACPPAARAARGGKTAGRDSGLTPAFWGSLLCHKLSHSRPLGPVLPGLKMASSRAAARAAAVRGKVSGGPLPRVSAPSRCTGWRHSQRSP